MRIAQVAPLAESCPPKLYGGTERVAHFLTEQLVKQGHQVTLFASGDSRTSAELVACVPQALRLSSQVQDFTPYHVAMVEQVRRRLDDFDIIHFHIDLFHYPCVRTWDCPSITTLHGRLDLPDLQPFFSTFGDIPLVSISHNQRRPLPPVNWVDTVYHGIPCDLLPFRPHGGDYLVFLGRISPEKRPDRAIEIAARAGLPLRMAAKIDRTDEDYWREHIAPLVRRSPHVEFLGEIDEAGDLPPSEWPNFYFRIGHEGGMEWRGSTSRKRSSASCVKRKSCWRRAGRWQMRAGGLALRSRATIAGARNMAV